MPHILKSKYVVYVNKFKCKCYKMKCMPVEQLYAYVLMFTDDTLIFILFFSLLLLWLPLRTDL